MKTISILFLNIDIIALVNSTIKNISISVSNYKKGKILRPDFCAANLLENEQLKYGHNIRNVYEYVFDVFGIRQQLYHCKYLKLCFC